MAGIEPDTPCAETPVSMKDSDFSPEALTKISGTDRQILSRIIQRGGESPQFPFGLFVCNE